MSAHLMAPGQHHGGYLTEVGRLLWPPPARAAPATSRAARGAAPGTDLIVLPGWRRPRLLVPAGRRPSTAAVRRYGEPGSVKARVATRLLAAALGCGAGALVFRDRLRIEAPDGAPTIGDHLSTVLGRPVLLSMHLGAARANRKPVLQLLTSAGETVGFAKIGVNPLTSALVRAEHDALAVLGRNPPAGVCVPQVLSIDHWQDLDVLILSPLPVWRRRRPLALGQLAAAMAAVAGVSGPRSAHLAASGYWQRLSQRLAAAGNSPDQAALGAALRQLAGQSGAEPMSFGASHGDWTPWNMANTGSGLLVWDWERFTEDAPVGFDMLHYWLQARVVDPRRDPRQEAQDCVGRAAELLAPLGVAAGQARLAALCYLADLSVRYLADRQQEAGARLGAPGRWLIPVLVQEVTSP